MKEFFKFAFRPHRLEVLVILAVLLLQTYLQLQIINLFKSALTHVKSENLALLNADGLWMLIYSLILIVVMIAVLYLTNNLSAKIAYETRRELFHIIAHLPPKELNSFKSTGLMARTTRGVFTEQAFIQIFLKNVLIIPFVTAGVIIEIFLIDSEFAFFFTIFVIIIAAVIIYKLKRGTEVYFKAKKTYGKINFLFREKVLGLMTINIFEKKSFEREKFDEAISDSYDKSLAFQLDQYYVSPMFILVFDLFVVGLLIFLFDFTIDPEMFIASPHIYHSQFSDIIIIIQYVLYFASTILVLPNLIDIWPRAYASSVRIEEVLVLEDKIIENKTKQSKGDFKGIEFRNVSFKSNEHEIIRNVSFKIPDKSTVAIVGPYSSGKTVLMYLLDGLYAADEGEILLDGFDIDDLTSSEINTRIGFAMQKSFLFNDTVYNNIALGDKDISNDDVVRACDESGLSKFFTEQFNLDSLIFENASNISKDFERKIMLARCIVRDRDIYIFDGYDYRMDNKTNIILTKDIGKIKDIEHIIVLDNGKIVGEGSHEELLDGCLAYKELYMGAA